MLIRVPVTDGSFGIRCRCVDCIPACMRSRDPGWGDSFSTNLNWMFLGPHPELSIFIHSNTCSDGSKTSTERTSRDGSSGS